MSDQVKVVVASRPGNSRSSILALLTTIKQVDVVRTVDGVEAISETTASDNPNIILVKAERFDQQVSDGLRSLHSTRPDAKIMLLAGDLREARKARSAGVECVLVDSVSADEMRRSIRKLVEGRDHRLGSYI